MDLNQFSKKVMESAIHCEAHHSHYSANPKQNFNLDGRKKRISKNRRENCDKVTLHNF